MTASGVNASAGASAPDYTKLREYLIATVTQDLGTSDLPPDKRQQFIQDRLAEALARTKLSLSDSIRNSLLRDILDDITGYGLLQSLLDDPDFTEIMVNGPKKVYIEKNGLLERTNVIFEDNLHILKIIDRIVSPLGRYIDSDSPLVDARLPDGSRVNAVVPLVPLMVLPSPSENSEKKVVNRAIDRIQLADGRDGRFPACLRPWSLEHHYFWRHRIWQDHVPKCAFWFYPGRGTNRHY